METVLCVEYKRWDHSSEINFHSLALPRLVARSLWYIFHHLKEALNYSCWKLKWKHLSYGMVQEVIIQIFRNLLQMFLFWIFCKNQADFSPADNQVNLHVKRWNEICKTHEWMVQYMTVAFWQPSVDVKWQCKMSFTNWLENSITIHHKNHANKNAGWIWIFLRKK